MIDSRADDLKQLAETMCRKQGQDVRHLFTDLSQSLERRPWSCGTLRAITTSTDLWSHGRGRRVSPQELLGVLGFVGVSEAGLSPGQLKDLLGECMAVPCVTLVLLSLIVHLPKFRQGT